MKTRYSLLLTALAACGSAPDDAAPEDTSPATQDTDATTDTDAPDDADNADGGDGADALRFLREEEKLARDVYLHLDATWGTPAVFVNISRSEQQHMDALGAQLARLGLPDPIVDDTPGVFTDATLADLYADLTADGEASVVAALTVGATIEDLDLVDLADAIAATSDDDLAATYAVLACGSRNHLRAFTDQLSQRGDTYTPQFLDPATYDSILAGAHEACGG